MWNKFLFLFILNPMIRIISYYLAMHRQGDDAMQTDILERPQSHAVDLQPVPRVSMIIRLPNGAVLTPSVVAGGTIADVLSSLNVALRADGDDCPHCRLRIANDWADRLPPPDQKEFRLIGSRGDNAGHTRLACQIELTAALDGLEFSIDASSLEPQTYWVAG
jgi:ferredoxin